MENIKNVLKPWGSIGNVKAANPFGNGHINDTYLVETDDKSYILQRINTNTFRDVDGLMENIRLVTEFITDKVQQAGGDVQRESMQIVRTDDGALYSRDENGGCWRIFTYITNNVCLQKARNNDDLFECTYAFGKFQRQLQEFPAEKLSETIPNFHNTVSRFATFEQVLAADKMGRAKDVQPEIEFLCARKDDCCVMVNMQNEGKLPLRVTHNDTKLNNVLLDEKTMKGLCVIDLDTVMPGLAGNDFGDTVRFAANDNDEDEHDQSRVHFLPELYRVCAEGFLKEAGQALTEEEIRTLPWGAKLMTLECGMRFLTDYLDGDNYFKIHRPDHNLDRARTQFTLVKQMEENWDELVAISENYIKENR